jgi:thioredoxin reductase (NADPH)
MPHERMADCLVVGAGPAGLTAAFYLRRYRRDVLLVDDGRSRALSIERTQNYPGFPDGVSGHALLQRLREQLEAMQGELVQGKVHAVEPDGDGGFVAQGGQARWRARTVLLSTGVKDAVPALPGIEELQQHGLLRQCPICDGYEHRGQRIVVLGDGVHAAREAEFISLYSPHVAHAGLSALPEDAGPGVKVLPALAASVGRSRDGTVCVRLADGSAHPFDIAYAALRVGPRSRLGSALGASMDKEGHFVIDAHGATDVRGVYAAGDVVHGLDQLVVATAQGALAATAIHNLLR